MEVYNHTKVGTYSDSSQRTLQFRATIAIFFLAVDEQLRLVVRRKLFPLIVQ